MLFTYEYFKNYNLNVIVPGYRLAPKSKFKEQIEDINNSINFIKKQYGENIDIILAGHSAGAHLAYYASKHNHINGLILSSGVYDLTKYTKKYVDQITSKRFSSKSISWHSLSFFPPIYPKLLRYSAVSLPRLTPSSSIFSGGYVLLNHC